MAKCCREKGRRILVARLQTNRGADAERWGMTTTERLNVSAESLAAVCSKYQVRELLVFGSMARGDAKGGSDVDLLVLFEKHAVVGLLKLARLQRELAVLLGRPVDLVPKDGLKPVLRDEVLAEAEVLYAA